MLPVFDLTRHPSRALSIRDPRGPSEAPVSSGILLSYYNVIKERFVEFVS